MPRAVSAATGTLKIAIGSSMVTLDLSNQALPAFDEAPALIAVSQTEVLVIYAYGDGSLYAGWLE